MKRHKKQSVILRSKVRQERRQKFWKGSITSLKWLLVPGFIFVAAHSFNRFFFQSGFFMINFVEVEPGAEKTSTAILGSLSSLKGRSIFSVHPDQLKEKLARQFTQARAWEVKRIFPDKVRVRYALRTPVAFVRVPARPPSSDGKNLEKTSERPSYLVDADGKIFSDDPSKAQGPVPEIVVYSTGTVIPALGFLKMWSELQNSDPLGLSTSSLKRVTVDLTGEVAIQVTPDLQLSSETTRIVWGRFDPKNFAEKAERFQQVWTDLTKKGTSVTYVNMRDVPDRKASVLGDREMVGRVIVRPKNQQASIKGSAQVWKDKKVSDPASAVQE